MKSFLTKSAALSEKGQGFKFKVIKEGQIYPAFCIRAAGNLHAYLNVCPHMGLKLNRDSNHFFCRSNKNLFCYAHGAAFAPASGKCLHGPCTGMSLISLKLFEQNEDVFLVDTEYARYL